ncbi:MAG: thioredoxin domain-containing protein [Patescibacteria group bacterium]
MQAKRAIFTIVAAAISLAVLTSYWRSAADSGKAPAEGDLAAPAPMDAPFVTMIDPAKGPKDAKITIVEFGDHACPYCKSSQDAVDRLLAARPDAVRFVWKSAPSPLHPGSDIAAEAALCAGRQGRFWEYHAKLFDGASAFDQASMAILASGLDLDSKRFNECLVQGLTRPLVERTVTEARALGMTSIPTLFIDGVRYEGALSYEQLLEATGL